jgi:acetyltransferase-like isoleucine patch superfamily enzyme
MNVVLRHPNKIAIGKGTVIDDNILIDAKGQNNTGITIGQNCFIGRNTILSCKNGDIVLGDRVNVGFNSEIFSGSKVVIGNDTLLAAYCYLIGGDHITDEPEKPITQTGSISRGINIGAACWLGAGAKVLDGVSIGEHAIVGAGAVVKADIGDFKIAVGIPAKVIKDRRQNASS